MSDGKNGLPTGWEQARLGDVIELKYGKALPAKARDNETYPVYGSNGVVGQHSKPLTTGSILIVGRKGSIGEVHQSDGPCSPIDTTYYIDGFHGQPVHYWYHQLRHLPLAELNRATALPGLNRSDAYALAIALPPAAEQQRIVARIESLQERSSRARAALAEVGPLLEQFRRSVLSAAFSGRLTADWRAANPDVEPASELLHRIRAERRQRWERAELAKYEAKGKKPAHNWRNRYTDPLLSEKHNHTDLPASWCWARLSDICTIQGGHAFKSSDYTKQGTPLVRIGDLTDGIVNISNRTKHLPLSFLNYYPDYILKHGDILIAMSGATTGKMAVYQDEQPALLNQRVGRFIPHSPKEVHRPYLRALVENIANDVRLRAYGGAQPNISPSEIASTVVAFPPLLEQVQISAALTRMMVFADSTQALIKELDSDFSQLDQSILAKAFRGELVPQDPADEPAAELLARIAAAREAAASSSKTSKRVRKPAAQKAAEA